MRELSAQLTEGEIFNSQIYIFAHTSKIAVNIQIADSNHCQFHALQILCAKIIIFCLLGGIVSTAIKFNNQTNLCTIEIYDIIPNCFLPLKPYWVTS